MQPSPTFVQSTLRINLSLNCIIFYLLFFLFFVFNLVFQQYGIGASAIPLICLFNCVKWWVFYLSFLFFFFGICLVFFFFLIKCLAFVSAFFFFFLFSFFSSFIKQIIKYHKDEKEFGIKWYHVSHIKFK